MIAYPRHARLASFSVFKTSSPSFEAFDIDVSYHAKKKKMDINPKFMKFEYSLHFVAF
jgi:hypothetical protein